MFNLGRASAASTYLRALPALLLVVVSVATAESAKIGDLELAVDQIVQIDNENVKVTLFGESRIVAKKELNHYVLGRYLSSSEVATHFSFSDLRKLLLHLEATNDSESAGIAFAAIMERYPKMQPELDVLIKEIAEAHPDKAASLFKDLVSNKYLEVQNKDALASVLYYLTLHDAEWVRSQALSVVYKVSSELHEIVDRHLREALSRHSVEEVAKLSKAFESVWGPADTIVSRMKLLQIRVEELQKLIKYSDIGQILPGLEARMKDPELSPLLSGIVVELIHQRANVTIESGAYEFALKLLTQVTADKRTPMTHKLTLQALKGISKGAPSLFAFDPDVFQFTRILADNDPEIKTALLQSLKETAAQLIAQGNLAKSEEILPKLIEVMPEQNQFVDSLKYAQAVAYASRGLPDRFEAKVGTIGGGLPLLYRAKLIAWRIRADRTLFIATGTGAILFLGWLGIYAERKRRTSVAPNREKGDDVAHANFVAMGELSPKRNEYDRCLRELGLPPSAELKEIKAAYRNLVKELHPDRQQTNSQDTSDDFIRLTQVYDRALLLRKELAL